MRNVLVKLQYEIVNVIVMSIYLNNIVKDRNRQLHYLKGKRNNAGPPRARTRTSAAQTANCIQKESRHGEMEIYKNVLHQINVILPRGQTRT